MFFKKNILLLIIYLDWGKYDYKITGEDMPHDVPRFSRIFKKVLEDKGYTVASGQVNDGSDLASWRVRTNKILETFFPIEK